MTTLESDFHPLLVGYKQCKENTDIYTRTEHDREYRMCARFLENDYWYELQIYQYNSSGSYYQASVPINKFYTVRNFYGYYIHKLSNKEYKYKAILEAEYRAFLLDEIIKDL